MQITVTKVETKDAEPPKKWKLTKWTAADGIVWATFDPKARVVGVGDLVDITKHITTDYGNDFEKTDWVLIEKASPEQAVAAAAVAGNKDNETRISIERQSQAVNILTYSAALEVADRTLDEHTAMARLGALHWIAGLFLPDNQTSEEAWKGLERTSEFANLGELLNWCREHGITKAKFMEIGRIDEDGMKKVNLEEAYVVVKDYLHEHKGG